MQITVKDLRDKEACPDQIRVFADAWPKGCKITLSVTRRALKLSLDLDWAARNFFTAPAEKAYQEATAKAFVAGARTTDKRG